LEEEQHARHREELNGLYVAVTRARERLVLSSVRPARANEGSWWARLEPLCEPTETDEPLVTLSAQAGAASFPMQRMPEAPEPVEQQLATKKAAST
ncbi:hypothetical protein DSI31_11205, partial [Mycobacterium tuberculosis]